MARFLFFPLVLTAPEILYEPKMLTDCSSNDKSDCADSAGSGEPYLPVDLYWMVMSAKITNFCKTSEQKSCRIWKCLLGITFNCMSGFVRVCMANQDNFSSHSVNPQSPISLPSLSQTPFTLFKSVIKTTLSSSASSFSLSSTWLWSGFLKHYSCGSIRFFSYRDNLWKIRLWIPGVRETWLGDPKGCAVSPKGSISLAFRWS